MNTSFSAMNTSLSQKWSQINQKSAATKREGQNLSNTMGGFGSSTQLESKIGKGTVAPMNQSIGANSSGQVDSQATATT
jgi:hypothetical protein